MARALSVLRRARAGGFGAPLARALRTTPKTRSEALAPEPLGDDPEADERADILAALSAPTPSISCVYLYDAHGSALFEQICATEEYYLTRTEDALLKAITPELIRFADEPRDATSLSGTCMVECSAGNGQKVAPVVLASSAIRPTTYVPMDVSASALDANAARLAPHIGARALQFEPLVGTNEDGLRTAAQLDGRKCYMLLGSSLGNATEPHEELRMVAEHMRPADRLVVGIDTPPSAPGSGGKTEAAVVAAYNDAAGITSAFTLNALTHLNRIAGTDFDLADFRHVSEWCPERSAILAYVEAARDVTVHARPSADAAATRVLSLRAGERIFMEQSAKFGLEHMRQIGGRAGLRPVRHWLSERDYYLIIEYALAGSS